MKTQIQIMGLPITLWRKPIKNLNLRILKPDGQIRVSVPSRTPEHIIERFILDKLDWIQAAQKRIQSLPQGQSLNYEHGESIRHFGENKTLKIHQTKTKQNAILDGDNLRLYVKTNATKESKQKLIETWQRKQLLALAEDLIEAWQPIIGKEVSECRIKKMTTRWGTCNIQKKRIWLSLMLAEKPITCIEYIIVHEMTHLHERLHNQRFHRLMDGFMPDWRERDMILKN